MDTILTDRSRIDAYQRCPRLRYWLYEHEERGLDLQRNAVAFNVGKAFHEGVAAMVSRKESSFGSQLLDKGLVAGRGCGSFELLERLEDRDLVEALIRTWWYAGLADLAGWMVLDVEKEESYEWHDKKLVHFMSRSDWIAQAPKETYLRGVPVSEGTWIWNLKSCRRADARWRLNWFYDMQMVSELLGPERRLGRRMQGVIVQGVIKENHPLVRAWRHKETGEVSPRYEWTCTEAHEIVHAKKSGFCPGGRLHRLGGYYEPVLVRDAVPGGQEGHFQHILAHDPDLLKGLVVTVGPLSRRTDYEVERWLEQNLNRECQISRVSKGDTSQFILDRFFPQHTARGNCISMAHIKEDGSLEGGCPALAICWGGASPEAYESRTPNHEEERLQWSR